MVKMALKWNIGRDSWMPRVFHLPRLYSNIFYHLEALQLFFLAVKQFVWPGVKRNFWLQAICACADRFSRSEILHAFPVCGWSRIQIIYFASALLVLLQ